MSICCPTITLYERQLAKSQQGWQQDYAEHNGKHEHAHKQLVGSTDPASRWHGDRNNFTISITILLLTSLAIRQE